jgi:hypothetical protein
MYIEETVSKVAHSSLRIEYLKSISDGYQNKTVLKILLKQSLLCKKAAQKLRLCRIKREKSKKVFKGTATKGKSTIGSKETGASFENH